MVSSNSETNGNAEAAKPETQVVQIEPARIDLRPGGTHDVRPIGAFHRAEQFLEASRSVQTQHRINHPGLHLASQALELALKAFLIHKQVPENELKQRQHIGHDLLKALERAEKEELSQHVTILEADRKLIVALSPYHLDRGFNYFLIEHFGKMLTGYKDLPKLSDIQNLAKKLLEGLRDVCSDIKPR